MVWFWVVSSKLGWCWSPAGGGASLHAEIPCGVDMERCFSVEAKKFFFSMRVDKADFRLEERKKDFVGHVFVGAPFGWWIRLKRCRSLWVKKISSSLTVRMRRC
jgi:hypothetical protein